MYDKYDLANRFRGRAPSKVVELGEVLKLDPLTIKIGNGTYEAGSKEDQWTFYEAWFEDRDAELKNGQFTGASVNCSEGSISQMSYSAGTCKERKAYMKYNVGDKLAVQQMAGDNSFIILCKVREVV